MTWYVHLVFGYRINETGFVQYPLVMLTKDHQSYINKKANSFRYLLFLDDSNDYPPAPGYPGFCTKFLFASSCGLGIGNKL